MWTLKKYPKRYKKFFLNLVLFILILGFFVFGFFAFSHFFPIKYKIKNILVSNTITTTSQIYHIETPEPLRAIYITSCVASMKSMRNKLVNWIDKTEINSVIIDIKDYSGTISIDLKDENLKTKSDKGCFVSDMEDFIKDLHDKNIYVIGRISVFQDPYYTKLHPELAVKKASDGTVWRDHKGLSFIDVSAEPYWEYIVKIGKGAYEMGFDELNFDYIRFPSDGNMKDIKYVWTGDVEKKEALRKFFGYLHKEFRDTGAVLSADLFGMTTTNTDDLNIGQYLEYALPYFDYIAPMVYPSHYPPNWNGYKNPADKPYEVIKYSMSKAYERASTTPLKLRPWLQDFDLGADYDSEKIKAQIKAVYDSGLTSWMLWSPSNQYTWEALELEEGPRL
jgi:hypothetical protein